MLKDVHSQFSFMQTMIETNPKTSRVNRGSEGEMDVAEDEPWEGFGGDHSGNDAVQTRQNHTQGETSDWR
jgi:hypothetical protein